MILMPQIFNVTANENARYKSNELEYRFYRGKTCQRLGVTFDVIDELRLLSLSKCFPALCHKLIYEIAIFHSINR